MLRFKRWPGVVAILLVCASMFFVALPRVSASPGLARQSARVASSHRAQMPVRHVLRTEEGLCSYSAATTTIIIDSDKWNNTTYLCGTGYLGHEIKQANDIYDNGGGPMWVKWDRGAQSHFCTINGLGAYWEFSAPVRITQIAYGANHTHSYCP